MNLCLIFLTWTIKVKRLKAILHQRGQSLSQVDSQNKDRINKWPVLYAIAGIRQTFDLD